MHRRAILTLTSSFALAAVVSVTGADAVAEKPPGWESSAGLGLTLTRGNSDTLLFTGNILTSRKNPRDEWSFGADGAYGESDDVKNTESLHGFGQYNRLFSDRAYGFLRLDGLHDAIADVEYRFTLSPGAGYYFIKDQKTQLSAEVGPGFVYEKQGGAERGYMALRLAERFEHKLNDRVRIWQSLECLPQVDDFDNYIVNAEIGLESSLTKKLSLRTYVQDTYDNVPSPGLKKNDLKWITGIAYKF